MIRIRTCITCQQTEEAVKFSGKHRECNKCRNVSQREYRAEYQRNRRANDPEFVAYQRAKTREYRKRHPHAAFFTTSRYLAGKAGVFSDLTMEDAYDIHHTPDECGYCGKERSPDDPNDGKRAFHIDHVIPMIQGGHNSRWNLVKVCISCNTSKGSSSLVDFRSRTPEFTDDRYDAIVAGMSTLSGRTPPQIIELLTQSHEFELAHRRERERMMTLLAA